MDAPPRPMAIGPYPSRFMPLVAGADPGENRHAINIARLAAESRLSPDLKSFMSRTPLAKNVRYTHHHYRVAEPPRRSNTRNSLFHTIVILVKLLNAATPGSPCSIPVKEPVLRSLNLLEISAGFATIPLAGCFGRDSVMIGCPIGRAGNHY